MMVAPCGILLAKAGCSIRYLSNSNPNSIFLVVQDLEVISLSSSDNRPCIAPIFAINLLAHKSWRNQNRRHQPILSFESRSASSRLCGQNREQYHTERLLPTTLQYAIRIGLKIYQPFRVQYKT